MRGKQHFVLGLAAGVTGALMLSETDAQQVGFVIACCAGSLFPDLDIPSSTIGHLFRPVSVIINKIYGHRGFFHTPLHLLACVFIFTYSAKLSGLEKLSLYSVPFGIGYTAHLIQDTFTHMGIKWLWPLKVDFRLIGIRSDNGALCWLITSAIFFLLWIPVLVFIVQHPMTYLF